VLAVTGSTTAAEVWLARPESAAALNAADLPNDIKGEFILLQAVMARFRHEDGRSLALARQVLALIPDDDQGIRAGVMYNMGVAHAHLGNLAAAEQAFGEAVILGESKGGPYMALIALQELSELHIRHGRLTLALETCRRAIEMSNRWGWQTKPMSGLAYIYQGQVLYQRNDLTKAANDLTKGIRLLRGSIEQYILAMGYAVLAQVYLVWGEVDRALATIEEGELWFSQMRISDTGAGRLLALGKVRLWLATGQTETAAQWFEMNGRDEKETGLAYRRRMTLVRLQLAQSRLERGRNIPVETADLLDNLLAQYESGGWQAQVIEILVLQSLLSALEGRSDDALNRLERALELAEPEGLVRIFADEGEPMAALLRQVQHRGRYPHFVGVLLAAFPIQETKKPGEELLPEPLSERELEVLQLMALGAANKEIAGQLFIAITTVKKHVGNILVKLDTTNRVQAITRARELGLIA
jgi:LuxR family maltose regulon positive regulatory protein